MKISDIFKYYSPKVNYLDLEILIANSLGKTREFVLTHPEYEIPSLKNKNLKIKISRRMRGEPIAYLLGHKEFYGLDFLVNKYTLVPRPETELMVDSSLDLLRNKLRNTSVIDIGTGSGCIITAIAHQLRHATCDMQEARNLNFYAIDISKEALKIAKKNARFHNLDKEIKFMHGDLLTPLIQNTRYKIQDTNLFITANLPYLSKEIFSTAPVDVKKYEPKTALYSAKAGLAHYEKLLKQLKKLRVTSYELRVTILLEISPEQKKPIEKLIKSIHPKAKIEFSKDLAGKWRLCKVNL